MVLLCGACRRPKWAFRSTHIARKLDGEGGSPRYMAPECYDAKIGKLTAARLRLHCLVASIFPKHVALALPGKS